MKIIEDIRFFKSSIENIDGNPAPESFGSKQLCAVIHRAVMKLREQRFTLGEYTHLYINFTVCLNEGQMKPSERSKDAYHPFYRYYDAGISRECYDKLDSGECIDDIVSIAENLLIRFFAADEEQRNIIESSFFQALEHGENMLMLFKEKQTNHAKAVIYLRFTNDFKYVPLLCVYDLEENEMFRQDLPAVNDLNSIGEIVLTNKKVTVKPRKNTFSKGLEAVSFDLYQNL